MSAKEQFNNLHNASNVLVDTDSPAFIRRIEALLIPPLTCKVYVVAPRRAIVSHSGAYEITQQPSFRLLYLYYCL